MSAERAALLRHELDHFVRVVSAAVKPERIILFGSLADGDVHEWSDLDIVLIVDSDLPFLRRPRAVLERVAPRVSMDLFVYTPAEWQEVAGTRPFLRDEILHKGRVIYERPGAAVAG
ncbi:MAG TPA: nucleotidyltransferase domain-containing protein [Chloroflexota bacterium]|nr:nucleotidyltransferase domain-containing protein [Chloroflexota bacterium]